MSSSGRSRPALASSASTTATCGRSTSIRSGRSGCAASSRTIASRSPSPVSANPPRSPAGGRSASTRRSSARRSCARPTRPRPLVRSWPPGAFPIDPAVADRLPFVKICGVVDADGVRAAIRAGADAIGLNVVSGTPRALQPRRGRGAGGADPHDRARRRAATDRRGHRGHRRGPSPRDRRRDRPGRRPAQRRRDARLRGVARADDLEGASPAGDRAERSWPRGGRASWSSAAGPTWRPGSSGSCSTRPAVRIPVGPAPDRPPSLAAAVARELPVILAGGLSPANVGSAVLEVPAVGVDVASGVEAPRVPGERPRKDPLRVALFAKRARAARADRPNVPSRPTPVDPGLLEADPTGRWGVDARLRRPLRARDVDGRARGPRARLRRDPPRPPLLGRVPRAARDLLRSSDADLPRRPSGRRDDGDRPRAPRRRRRGVRAPAGDAPALPQARGPRPYRRPQDQQRARSGAAHATARQVPGHRRDRRRPARRGDRHRLRPARPAVRRVHGRRGHPAAAPNVLRMRALGTEVRPVTSGSATLKDAVNEAMRDWVTNVETTHYVLGSAMGPHPYPTIVRDLQRVLGDESAAQLAGRRRPAARPRPRLRRRRFERDRPARSVHRRAVRPAGRGRGRRRRDRDRPTRGGAGRRDAGHPPRQPIADAPGP